MSLIQVSNLTFGYEKSLNNVFENVSFNIDTNWKLGLIGRNGKGKTTLLKLLEGKYLYNGKISKSVDVEYFPVEVADETKLTSEILNEIVPYLEQWKIEKEFNLLNIKLDVLDRKFETLSGGEKVKVLLVSMFLKENNFLLIDEPTNHLDNKTVDEVCKYLKMKSGYILVSHDRKLLDDTVDHIICINNIDITVEKGNFSSWKENKERKDNFEISQNEKVVKEIERLDEAAKRISSWAENVEASKYNTLNSGSKIDRGYVGHKSAKMMKKAITTVNRKEKSIEEKSKLLKNIDRADELTIKPLTHEKNILVTCNDLIIRYSDKNINPKISFEVRNGDRVAITGKNGSGKSSILKLIIGEEIPYSGAIKLANNLKISYVPQNVDYLKGSLKELAKTSKIDEGIFKAMLIKLGFSSVEFNKDISELSYGQKKKVLIAKSITESADLYIWDEPFNFIDIISRMQIEEAILKHTPTMIFVEHDNEFVNNVATNIIDIN